MPHWRACHRDSTLLTVSTDRITQMNASLAGSTLLTVSTDRITQMNASLTDLCHRDSTLLTVSTDRITQMNASLASLCHRDSTILTDRITQMNASLPGPSQGLYASHSKYRQNHSDECLIHCHWHSCHRDSTLLTVSTDRITQMNASLADLSQGFYTSHSKYGQNHSDDKMKCSCL
jgi:hypothetical protein